jgi:hypothetical protein
VTQPQIFAIAGCAAWISAVTKTFSGLIIVLEISKQFDLLLPLLLTNLFALLITGVFSIGFFDFIISMRRLPYMPTMLCPSKINTPARDVSRQVAVYLRENCSFFDVLQLFLEKQEFEEDDIIPVIGKEDFYLKGQTKFREIFEMSVSFIAQFRNLIKQHQGSNVPHNIYDVIFEQLKDYPDVTVDEFVDYTVKEIKRYLNKVKFNVEKFVMNDQWKMLDLEVLKESKNYERIDQSMYRQTIREFRKLTSVDWEHQVSTPSLDIQMEQEIMKKCFRSVLGSIKNNEQYHLINPKSYGIQVHENTPMVKIHFLFFTLRADNIFLSNETGTLTGYISKNMFLDFKTN